MQKFTSHSAPPLEISAAPAIIVAGEDRSPAIYRRCRYWASIQAVVQSVNFIRESLLNKSVLITVANDGTPLDKEMQKRVFERFYSGPDGSTGIGLALTKDIVELHRGTICAKGKDGRTVFEIRLPK